MKKLTPGTVTEAFYGDFVFDTVLKREKNYRLGPVNSNTGNSKFHLIQTFFKISATFLSFQC